MSFTSITIQMTALFDVLILTIKEIDHRAVSRSKLDAISYRAARLAVLREDIITYQELVR